MSDVYLNWADLSGADLEGTALSDARYNAQTKWPDGVNPKKRGAKLEQ